MNFTTLVGFVEVADLSFFVFLRRWVRMVDLEKGNSGLGCEYGVSLILSLVPWSCGRRVHCF